MSKLVVHLVVSVSENRRASRRARERARKNGRILKRDQEQVDFNCVYFDKSFNRSTLLDGAPDFGLAKGCGGCCMLRPVDSSKSL